PARPTRLPLQELTHVQVQDTLLTMYVLTIGRPEHIRHLLSYLESNSFRNELADGRSLTTRGASQNVHFHLFTKRRLVEPAVAIAGFSNAHGPTEPAEIAFIRGEKNAVKSFDLLENTPPTVVVPPKWLEGTWPVDVNVTKRSLDLEQILETIEQAALKGMPESPEKVAAFNIAYRKK